MPDYQNGKIYKLVNTEGTLTYIGSTCQTLAMRKAKHHNNFKRWKNDKNHFVTSFKVFDDDEEGCQIVLLENFPCDSKIELEKRERHYIETIECINKHRPTRTIKEYYIDNKQCINEANKKYYNDNKEQLQKFQKQYYEYNKKKIKQYYEDNKQYIRNRLNVKNICACGGIHTTANKTHHLKSMKHLNYINSVKAQEDELEKLEKEFNEI